MILIDNNLHRDFGTLLDGYPCEHVRVRGWENLTNGVLLSQAEEAGFTVLLTADKSIPHQQNMEGRKIALLIVRLHNLAWPSLQQIAPFVIQQLEGIQPGEIRVASASKPGTDDPQT